MTGFDREAVEAEYKRLGYRSGWTFLGTPEHTLHNARVGFVGLNPGGGGPSDPYEYGGLWDVPSGNGYFDERWGPHGSYSPIQVQVQKWYELLGLQPTDAFCAQLVPFRSPNWTSLNRKNDALAFASKLWAWVFEVSPAILFVTMGKQPAQLLAGLLGGKHVARLPTGWGSQTIEVWESPSGRRVVGMPHPSRHTLFNRPKGSSRLAEASFRQATG
jgi:hypothetical protein